MNQLAKTGIFVGIAIVLALIAALVVPSQRTPGVFQDQGQPFFKEFSPLAIGSVEITGYDAEQGEPKPFKVELRNGRWVIPSAQDYVADVKDRLARATALLVGLKKGDLASDRESDFASLGVIDPLDEATTATKGRGRRVTVKDQHGAVLADLIVGNSKQDNPRLCYVREPGNKRIYSCQIDGSSISTRFADWVETDVLKLGTAQIRKLIFDNYKVRTEDRTVMTELGLPARYSVAKPEPGDTVTLNRDGEQWALDGGLPAASELNKDVIDTAKNTLSSLTLVGVRRKPEGLNDAVTRYESGKFASESQRDLYWSRLQPQLDAHFQQIGYFLAERPENGKLRIFSREGDIKVCCEDGVVYTLRMGDRYLGDPDEIAGIPATQPAKRATTSPTSRPSSEHRFLFVNVDFDASLLGPKPAPPATRPTTQPMSLATTQPTTQPADPAEIEYQNRLKDYEKKLADGKKRRDDLAKKFDEWYYLVSADAYAKVKLDRGAIVKKIVAPETQPAEGSTTQPATRPAMPTTQPQ